MPQSHVARQSNDIILKLVATAFGGDLFRRFDILLPPIVAALPSELPQVQVSTRETDLLFRLADDSKLHRPHPLTTHASAPPLGQRAA